MKYPYLRVPGRRRYRIGSFLGYDRRVDAPAGSFREMENASSRHAPLLTVRPRRTLTAVLDGNPTTAVFAIGGDGRPVVLDASGSLWCGGHSLPRILPCRVYFTLTPEAEGMTASVVDDAALRAACPADGDFRFVYNQYRNRWILAGGTLSFPASAVDVVPAPENGDAIEVRVRTLLHGDQPRSLVSLGGWVCVFPDGLYANTVRLAAGMAMRADLDWGSIEVMNECTAGHMVFEPCGADGVARTVAWSSTAPEGGFWVDTSEETPAVRAWSQSEGLWREVQSYVKCSIPGIAKGVYPGDAVTLSSRLSTEQGGEAEVMAVLNGEAQVLDAFHDFGAGGRAEGTDDWILISGLISQRRTYDQAESDRSFVILQRTLPEMDFVVSCQNRLWGCRCGGGVNELYGSKLGDFRNWSVFEGLSTDSYRVSRGSGGPFTGAAVLGGCPLFFREDRLEKIYPAASGAHGVVTVSLNGIAPKASNSAVVIRDRLYYRARDGFCCYTGTLPVRISDALEGEFLGRTAAGALGEDYCAAMEDERGMPHLFVYHTDTGLWDREDDENFAGTYPSGGRLYYHAYRGGPLRCIGEAKDSDGVTWSAETGSLGPILCTKRYVSRLQLEGRLDPGSELRVYLSWDGGEWTLAGSFHADRRRAALFPIYPRRSGGVRLRLEGTGGMELRGISWLVETGSDA